MTAPPLRPASSLGYQVNQVARLFETALRHRIAGVGVVPGQFPALLALYETDGRTQRELSTIASVDQSTMAKTLSRMRRDGLIREEPDPGDRRAVRYRLTEHARALEPTLAAAGHEVIDAATHGIASGELATFQRVLTALRANLEATAARSGGPAA